MGTRRFLAGLCLASIFVLLVPLTKHEGFGGGNRQFQKHAPISLGMPLGRGDFEGSEAECSHAPVVADNSAQASRTA